MNILFAKHIKIPEYSFRQSCPMLTSIRIDGKEIKNYENIEVALKLAKERYDSTANFVIKNNEIINEDSDQTISSFKREKIQDSVEVYDLPRVKIISPLENRNIWDYDLHSVDYISEEYLPEHGKFLKIDKAPNYNSSKIDSLLDIVNSLGFKGIVVVGVLVNKNGFVEKKKIEYSDYTFIEYSAIKIIDKYGKFEPAIRKGKPIACWLSVPITFKLRDKENKENE